MEILKKYWYLFALAAIAIVLIIIFWKPIMKFFGIGKVQVISVPNELVTDTTNSCGDRFLSHTDMDYLINLENGRYFKEKVIIGATALDMAPSEGSIEITKADFDNFCKNKVTVTYTF
jgi:hypothetical protein